MAKILFNAQGNKKQFVLEGQQLVFRTKLLIMSILFNALFLGILLINKFR